MRFKFTKYAQKFGKYALNMRSKMWLSSCIIVTFLDFDCEIALEYNVKKTNFRRFSNLALLWCFEVF